MGFIYKIFNSRARAVTEAIITRNVMVKLQLDLESIDMWNTFTGFKFNKNYPTVNVQKQSGTQTPNLLPVFRQFPKSELCT